jgi:rod shape-determining protein MreC
MVAVLVLVSVTLITFDERSGTNHVTSGLKSVAHDVFSPITAGVNDLLRPIGDFFAGSVHYGALQQENQRLQAALGQLQLKQREIRALAKQEQQLRALEQLSYTPTIKVVTAQMINQNLSDFDADITIGKGRDQGVTVGEPVVAAGGLIGQVFETSHNTAMVRLITDSSSSVGVAFGPSNETYAVVNGQGPGSPLSVQFVSAQTALHKGEQMYTSGLDGAKFPANIPVGVVHSFRSTVGSGSRTVTLTPSANLHQLAYVDVLIWEPPV